MPGRNNKLKVHRQINVRRNNNQSQERNCRQYSQSKNIALNTGSGDISSGPSICKLNITELVCHI